MESFDIQTALMSLGKLQITGETTTDDAASAMNILGNFNQCMIGVVKFSGLTPWERHPDDELLYVLEGEVEVKVLDAEVTHTEIVQAGSVFIVPRNLWHNQKSNDGVKLLFITSKEGNEHSSAEDPPSDR